MSYSKSVILSLLAVTMFGCPEPECVEEECDTGDVEDTDTDVDTDPDTDPDTDTDVDTDPDTDTSR